MVFRRFLCTQSFANNFEISQGKRVKNDVGIVQYCDMSETTQH